MDTPTFLPFDLETNVQNAWRLSTAMSHNSASNSRDLKLNYGAGLNILQNSRIPFKADTLILTFDDKAVFADMQAAGLLGGDSTVDDKHIFSAAERGEIEARISDALEYIRAANPDILLLIRQLIGTMVVCKQPDSAGGSVAGLTGLVWLNPRPAWTVVDYAEIIVHEYLHNSMFLADMVDNIFRHPANFENEQVVSAILGTPRPFDRAFHSAWIVSGLQRFFEAANQHERAGQVAWALHDSLAALQEKRYLLTEHGESMLDDLLVVQSERGSQEIDKVVALAG